MSALGHVLSVPLVSHNLHAPGCSSGSAWMFPCSGGEGIFVTPDFVRPLPLPTHRLGKRSRTPSVHTQYGRWKTCWKIQRNEMDITREIKETKSTQFISILLCFISFYLLFSTSPSLLAFLICFPSYLLPKSDCQSANLESRISGPCCLSPLWSNQDWTSSRKALIFASKALHR